MCYPKPLSMRYLILLFLALPIQLVACSAVVLKNGQTVLLAKNFDWTYGSGFVIKNLRGVNKRAFPTAAGTPAQWISKYGSVTFNQNGKEMPYGGINEKGLAIEMLWLDYTVYYTNSATPYVNELEWIQYQLDNYATVAEVMAHAEELSIRPFKGKVHFIIADAEGHSVVLEHIAGTIRMSSRAIDECQTITNYDVTTSDAYTTRPTALKGNVTSALYRYARLQAALDKNNFSNDLTEKTAFALLDKVSIRKGSFKTYWSIVYDLKRRTLYFKSADAPMIKNLALETLDFDRQPQAVPINATVKNVAPLLENYTLAVNTNQLKASFTALGLEKLDFGEVSAHQFNFSAPDSTSYTTYYTALKITCTTADSTKLGKLSVIVMNSAASMQTFTPFRDAFYQLVLNSPLYSWVYYGLPKGEYAAAAALNLSNNSRKPDYETMTYAFSNGARAVNGSTPSFDASKVTLTSSAHEIHLVLMNPKR